MKRVELYQKDRHAVMIDGMSRRWAATYFGINRKTVNKMLVFPEPPQHGRSGRTYSRKLAECTEIIDKILADDRTVHAKQRHTATRIFERLRDEQGFTGGITIVRDYVANAKLRSREVFIPLSHKPGHAQVDFGEADGIIGGKLARFHYFCMDLPHSDAPFIKAYPAEVAEAFCEGHVAALAFLRLYAALDPVRQHQAGGGADPGRREARAQPDVFHPAKPQPVRGQVWSTWQGQRQGQC